MTTLARFFAALSLAALAVLTVSLTASAITHELAARGGARLTGGGVQAVERALILVSLPVFVLASIATAAMVLWATRDMSRRRGYRRPLDGSWPGVPGRDADVGPDISVKSEA